MTKEIARIKENIRRGKTSLGIEFGSTRIKAVLVDDHLAPIAVGLYSWENRYQNGYWTYSLDEIEKGLQESYAKMSKMVFDRYGEVIQSIGSIGVSGMMHGYMAFDKSNQLLVPFRTWRNGTAEKAAKELTEIFQCNIPNRWSIAHLYQAILNKEEHVEQIQFMTTLAGYVHWRLTGEKVLGIGDASGMFPINSQDKSYDRNKIKQFNQLIQKKGVTFSVESLLPKIMVAGEKAGCLSKAGAQLIDITGTLCHGVPLCPPEGDAGTGMVATNSVAIQTGNISVGTSVFAMVVLKKELQKVYPEIDMITAPNGNLVAMIHANNCSSELNAWINIFDEFTKLLKLEISSDTLFSLLLENALKGDANCGEMIAYGYYSGEDITNVNEGRPLLLRKPSSNFNLANLIRLCVSTSFATLRIGMELLKNEQISIKKFVAHGGMFKTPEVAQRILASAIKKPVMVLDNANEGGAWGIALLASYMQNSKEISLEDFLKIKVFSRSKSTVITPYDDELVGYDKFMENYIRGLSLEQQASLYLK